MYGGPPVPRTNQRTEDRDPVGDYKLVHDIAAIAERLFQQPGQVAKLEPPCPACGSQLLGKANKYSRSVSVWCSNCSFRVNR